MSLKGIKGAIGMDADLPIQVINEKVFSDCNVRIHSITPVKYDGKDKCVVGFEIGDSAKFPTLLNNYRSLKEEYKLSMNVFVSGKKVNLEVLK